MDAQPIDDLAWVLGLLQERVSGVPVGLALPAVDQPGLRIAALWPGAEALDFVVLPEDGTACGYVIETGQPLVISSLDEDEAGRACTIMQAEKLRSFCGFPLRSADGRVVGVLGASSTEDRIWSTGEQRDVAAFARIISLILHAGATGFGAEPPAALRVVHGNGPRRHQDEPM